MSEMEKTSYLDEFYSITNHITAVGYYNSFCNEVKNHNIKLDGSNPLLSLIDKYVLDDENERFIKKVDLSTKFYRARIVRDKDINLSNGFELEDNKYKGFNETNSREAPFGIEVPAGRNNLAGMSYIYLANDLETACSEVKPTVYDIISVAEFENTREFKIIDFSDDVKFSMLEEMDNKVRLSLLFTYIMKTYIVPASTEEQYLIPQFVSDYIRKAGFDGIAYKSFYSKDGVNYTIFNSHHSFLRFNGSRLMVFQSQKQRFLDLNDKSIKQVDSLIEEDKKDEVYNDITNHLLRKLH